VAVLYPTGKTAATRNGLLVRELTVARRAPRERGVKRPRSRASGSRGRTCTEACGVIFGATLKSVLRYAGVAMTKGPTRRALRQIARFVQPVTGSVCRISGDREPLARGLLCMHVVPAQCRELAESQEASGTRTHLGKTGLKDVAVGVTVGVLVAHYVAACSGADAETIALALDEAVAAAERTLDAWRRSAAASSDAAHGDCAAAALCAERRALQRAQAGAHAAVRQARVAGLDHDATLRLQLEAMRHAVFPPGVRCDAATHAVLCETIAGGSLVGDGAAAVHEMVAPVPLAAIPSAAWMEGGDGSSEGSEGSEGGSSVGGSSSAPSSTGSSVGDGDGEMDVDLAEVAAAFGV
jgi:hypothetical protein